MGQLRSAGPLLVVVGALASGCGGTKAAPAPPRDPARAGAEAVVTRLADGVRDDDPLAACRTLTLATRRVVALLGPPGASCPTGLAPFLVVHGLRRALPQVADPVASVLGSRAAVRADALPEPLTAVERGAAWRVSLIGLPGVRADVGAARACGSYLDAADRVGLPPFTPAALADRLRGQARGVHRLRRSLDALPAGGPPRLGLDDVTRALVDVREGLREQARRVGEGGAVERGMQASARADLLVRRLLAQDGRRARVACPFDPGSGPQLARRRALLDRACDQYGAVLDALDADPDSRAEALENLRAVDRALVRLDVALRRAPVEPRLRRLRAAARRGVVAMRRAVAALATSAEDGTFDAVSRRVAGHGAQLDAALVRLGATCLDPARRTAPAPPAPSPLPPAPSPGPGSPGRLPPGTVEA